jgi:glucosamine--fructose-6-phosphate aminotransferase (isomerizing)
MEILQLPQKVRSILSKREKIKVLAEKYLGYDDFLFIGREYNIPTAYEGAHKLKKVSYVHAEGYPAGEIKHGPIAMINEVFPTFAIMPSDSVYQMMKNDVKEIREKKGGIIAIATEGNRDVLSVADDVMYIPDTKQCLTPILASIPLQLFAYYTGGLRGFNVDYKLDRTRDSLYN